MNIHDEKLEDFCNQLIEPGYTFDELAILIVCFVKKVHCLVLCDNTYWTTRSKYDYSNCLIKLCYLGRGVYKEVSLKLLGKSVSFGSKRKGIHVVDPVSLDFNVGHMPEMIDMTEDPSGSIEPEQTTDSIQIQMDPTQQSVPTSEYDGDLVDTGILPELAQDIDTLVQLDFMQEGPNGPDTNMDSVQKSDEINEVSTHLDEPDRGIDNAANDEPNSDNHVDKTNQETEAEVMDKNQPGPESTDLLSENQTEPGLTPEDTTEQQEIQVNQTGTDLNNIRVDPATAKQLCDREAVLKLGQLKEDKPQYHKDSMDSELYEEQDGAPVPVEPDGWEPESNRRRRKRQTTVIPTTSGQLAVQTGSIEKRIPQKRKHSCHLCGEDFDMQSQFTTHMKKTHPNDMFQCERCDKTLESANSLFKHQRSHLYLKHACEVCE